MVILDDLFQTVLGVYDNVKEFMHHDRVAVHLF